MSVMSFLKIGRKSKRLKEPFHEARNDFIITVGYNGKIRNIVNDDAINYSLKKSIDIGKKLSHYDIIIPHESNYVVLNVPLIDGVGKCNTFPKNKWLLWERCVLGFMTELDDITVFVYKGKKRLDVTKKKVVFKSPRFGHKLYLKF